MTIFWINCAIFTHFKFSHDIMHIWFVVITYTRDMKVFFENSLQSKSLLSSCSIFVYLDGIMYKGLSTSIWSVVRGQFLFIHISSISKLPSTSQLYTFIDSLKGYAEASLPKHMSYFLFKRPWNQHPFSYWKPQLTHANFNWYFKFQIFVKISYVVYQICLMNVPFVC